jgi:hypothetical protein
MHAASPHGAARLPPDEHLRSACRRGKKSKAKSRSKARARARARSKDRSLRQLLQGIGCIQLEIWSAVRPPSLASQLPQWDRVSSVRNWSAGRPPSLASQFLHGTECFQSEIGRLSGRLRWQASSHSGIGCHQLEIGRLSGRHRWQASSHSGIGCFQLEIGRLSGRHRWQASSHNFIRAHPMRRSRPTQHDER